MVYSSGLRVLLAGGGTGGHLRPALNLAKAILTESEDNRVSLIVSGRSVEQSFLSAHEDEFGSRLRVHALFPGWASRPPPYRADVYFRAYRGCLRLRREFEPHLTGLFGGYVSALALFGRKPDHPALLFESNVIPGKVARFLSRRVDRVITQWESTRRGLEGASHVIASGMPLEPSFFDRDRQSARRELGLDEDLTTLLFLGGSQGAMAVNRLAMAVMPRMNEFADRLQILTISGARQFEGLQRAAKTWPVRSAILPFLDDMPLAYAASDLAICRAGGMTVCELAATATPSILVPYPHHADQHQKANAMELVDAGAAELVEEEPDDESRLEAIIRRRLDSDRLIEMRRSALELSRRSSLDDAMEVIVSMLSRPQGPDVSEARKELASASSPNNT